MRTRQLQEATRRFSELVSEALARGPQRVTRHGKTAVIVVSEDEWNGITRKIPSFGRLLARARVSGAHVSAEDALIAATADLGALIVLTAHARHFAPMRVRYADPLAGLPPDAGP